MEWRAKSFVMLVSVTYAFGGESAAPFGVTKAKQRGDEPKVPLRELLGKKMEELRALNDKHGEKERSNLSAEAKAARVFYHFMKSQALDKKQFVILSVGSTGLNEATGVRTKRLDEPLIVGDIRHDVDVPGIGKVNCEISAHPHEEKIIENYDGKHHLAHTRLILKLVIHDEWAKKATITIITDERFVIFGDNRLIEADRIYLFNEKTQQVFSAPLK